MGDRENSGIYNAIQALIYERIILIFISSTILTYLYMLIFTNILHSSQIVTAITSALTELEIAA